MVQSFGERARQKAWGRDFAYNNPHTSPSVIHLGDSRRNQRLLEHKVSLKDPIEESTSRFWKTKLHRPRTTNFPETPKVINLGSNIKPKNLTESVIRNIERDPLVRGAKGVSKWASGFVTNRFLPHSFAPKSAKVISKMWQKIPRGLKRGGGIGGLAVGAVAMFGIGMMKGMMNSSQEYVYDRYMQDAQSSRNLLSNTRIGSASGTSQMLNRSGTQGLSLALSRTRHGA